MTVPRFDFFGVGISKLNPVRARGEIAALKFDRPRYACFPDASVVAMANDDDFLRQILNSSYLTLPDGKPSELAARLRGEKEVKTVSGYHLLRELLAGPLTHYFYGADAKVLAQMRAVLEKEFPRARILGYKAPPFTALEEIAASETIYRDIREINALKPDLVWVGISSPKQDYLMHYYHGYLDKSLMMGVGGVFLYLADSSLKSPEWIKRLGLRWLYRLWKEPRRLWPKYRSTLLFLLKNRAYFLKQVKQAEVNADGKQRFPDLKAGDYPKNIYQKEK